MALNRYFFSFSLSPSIELRRANLLLTSRTLLDQRIQGYKEPKDIQNIRKLDNVFGFQPKRLYINCSASAKPENEDSSQKEDVHTLKASLRTMGVSSTPALTLTRRIIAAGLRSVIAIIITLFLTILGAPSLLSCKQGRSAALFLINTYIPGYMDVQSLSLGWTEPIRAEQISLKGVDEKLVLSIMKLETQASLWSLIRQKSGLGVLHAP
ncbi:hypothetical protein KP509_07G008300 [Ceratopteris richardii]|uniref:Uncharacterized protein n=1 Tax=Ceratopteris richardii TaxID=49495 RepID=A0A8T2UBS6_CERRI|nr:hypothetical protein KP509_07G008300 [Ceratopteris richardii]